jgi:hypothetical protein
MGLRTRMVWLLLAAPAAAAGFEVNDQVDITTAFRGLVQLGDYASAHGSGGKPLDTATGGAGILDLTASFQPTAADKLFAWGRFAAGNGLNGTGGLALDPYGDPLANDLTDINGSGRNYLLEAWYRHTFPIGAKRSLAATAGIMDSDDFIGGNEYTDEEDTEFMNEGFGYSGTDIFPAYTPGSGLRMDLGQWVLSTEVMSSRNESGRTYAYYGGQTTYRPEVSLGEGNYRLFAFATSPDFESPDGTRDNQRLTGWGFSFDQALGELVGAFVRGFWADSNAATSFNRQLALGLNISGRLWGREQDNAGIGYAQLRGPLPDGPSQSSVAEAYVRFQLTRRLDLSLDLQYQETRTGLSESQPASALGSPSAWIAGIRVNLVF